MRLKSFFLFEATPGGGGSKMPPASNDKPAAGPQIMMPPAPERTNAAAGVRITGDAATLGALENILSDVQDESLVDWADDARDALASALRKGGDTITVTLPTFKQGIANDADEGDLE